MQNLLIRAAQVLDPDNLEGVPKGNLDPITLTDALQWVFGVFAAVAVLVIAIAAFRIVISRGNPQDVSKSRDTIIYAAVGLAISLMAFTIVTFVVERV